MLKKTIWILSIILLVLLSVSMVSAIDNTTIDTNCIDDTENENQVILTEDNNPAGDFKELSELVENTSQGNTLKLYKDYKNTGRSNAIQIDKSMTIDGQGHTIDANNYSEIFFINTTDVTLKNINFINSYSKYYGGAIEFAPNSNFAVENSSFAYCSAELGGAVYVGANSTLNVTDSNFTNCFADSGGAIYYETGSSSSITNSNFNNNVAWIIGGSLIAKEGTDLMLFETSFINSSAKYESGGAFALIQSDLKAQYIKVIDCASVFGGALTLLSTNTTITNSAFNRNYAVYDGGAIFAMYGEVNLYGNDFKETTANRGGALYLSQTNNTIVNNLFESNFASLGSAVYSMACNDVMIENNPGLTQNNYSAINDNLIITSMDFNTFTLNGTIYTVLPSQYSMLDDYTLTPVKDQGSEGNCWAFAAMAVLESCMVKSSNATFDLSEANLKNLMAMYSDYGFDKLTNDGGFSEMVFGYLASWLGPIYEKDDFYSINDYLSPLLSNVAHIQNILLLERDSFTDNDAIKNAILNYGAVGTSMHFDYDYLKSFSYYYNGFEAHDHAVTIVGWDDNYSKHNFRNTPPGDGAWIVRNSWGPTWGNNGYFYVSYYDSKFAEVNEAMSYTFILNDTVPLNRNYQYETGYTSRMTPDNSSNEVSYKNIFTSIGDENLAAVSTYFIESCDYNVSIYINDIPVASKSGNANAGYSTIYLDDMVGLNTGDVVTVQFDCKNFKNGVGRIACSAKSLMANLYLKEGVSYYWSGFKWIDFSSKGAIGCIKMFTSFSNQSRVTPYFQAVSQKNVTENSYIVTVVLPPYATGFVSFNIAGNIERINISQTRSIKLYNLDKSNNTLNISYEGDDRYLPESLIYVVDLNSDKGNFDELTSKIGVLDDGDVLNLTKDYCYVSGSTYGIAISNSITIEGNGHVIDANNQSAIFNIFADNTILKNIRFIGANNGDWRGAIYLQGSNCSIINCSFEDNFASEYGGAIYLSGTDCKIINCSFVENHALTQGGAIRWIGDGGILDNCSFVNNSALYGGAVFVEGYVTMIKCSFADNFASNYGGSIYWSEDYGFMSNCSFVENSADYGGAVYWAGNNGNLSHCYFAYNSAGYAGAVRLMGNNTNVVGCEFIGNIVSVDGGAVYSSGNGCNMADNYFADNYASRNGGALYLFGESCNLSNSSFDHNSGNYQLIWNVDSGNIAACYFIDSPNRNIYNGGATVVKNSIEIVCINTTFEYKNPQTLSFYLNNPYVPTLTFKLINGNTVVKTFNTNNISRVYEELAALDAGEWKLQVSFREDDTYYKYDKTFTLVVTPAFSSLNLSAGNVTLGHETILIASVADINGSAIGEGVVTFMDGNDLIGTSYVENGVASFKYSPKVGGEHKITARYAGNNYEDSGAEVMVYVNDVAIEIIANSGVVGFDSTFVVNVSPLYSGIVDGSISFYLNDEFIGKKSLVSGKADMTYLPLISSDYVLKAVYGESQVFSAKEATANYKVKPADSQITVNGAGGVVGSALTLTANVTSSNNRIINEGSVEFYDGNVMIGSANVRDGTATLKYAPTSAGSRQISAQFVCDNYDLSKNTVTIFVEKANVQIEISDATFYYDTLAAVEIDVLSNGKPVNEGTVRVFVNNQQIDEIRVVGGHVEFEYRPTSMDAVNVTAVFGETPNYKSGDDARTIGVDKLATNLEAPAVTEYYNDGKYLIVVLKDANGKALSGEKISINLNGAKYLTTDANGQVKLPTAGLKPKTYSAAITFEETDNYLKSTKNVNVIVKKATPKLTASKKTFKRKVKVKKYSITLKNNKNKAMAKVKVTIKVKGKTFTATTNSKGKATFKIKKLTKKGKYSSTVTFKGDSCYNKVTRKVTITVK